MSCWRAQIRRIHVTFEGLRPGLHWVLLKTDPVLQDCFVLAQAWGSGTVGIQLHEQGDRAEIVNRSGRDLLVIEGEPVPGCRVHREFSISCRLCSGEHASLPLRPVRRAGRFSDRHGGPCRDEIHPAPGDCGYLAIVDGHRFMLTLFGDPALFHAHAPRLHREACRLATGHLRKRSVFRSPRDLLEILVERLAGLELPKYDRTESCRLPPPVRGCLMLRQSALLCLRVAGDLSITLTEASVPEYGES